ncbi:GNAT family protein [Propionicimonas sp.]|uniref:GNAT family N-acetyltransferase n=1 Tax=Propionicimonas sp. TaxID=1955623 RepID=UPI0017CAE71A|nr:GNAT family protein [Propionicimonas sp.]MBU3978029.1 GNAT family N-acetyltransferase [Actinomycetota bacterium]MBA3021984.1 GNAT family N-acetyltransferase [Propionicimonas sp.]MBU3985529.1 GNAT family N-acetyltransferase [Actinomycetota bacterium]MBU4007692.1 GNAT family N-acetyltransferase [Actinomycetota bacterium]MBU4064467.1 GNAT family N-acetyltransferase [Actinomycetota bacterium]
MSFERLDWPLLTARLTLRPARASDAAEIWGWQQLPEVIQWTPRQLASLEAFTDHWVKHLDRTLVVAQGGRLIGSAKVSVQNAWSQEEVVTQAAGAEAEIGWALDPSIHGQGYGTELAVSLLAICFDGLGLHRVVGICFADNAASARVMEKAGMRREAHFRADSLHRDGRWYDTYCYAMLASEWAQQRASDS